MIIDASIGVKWIIPEEGWEAAAALAAEEGDLVVPTLFHSEVGNAIWKKARRGEIAFDAVEPHLSSLSRIVSTVSEIDLIARAASIAVELEHPIYDCVYVALAEEREDEVVTADVRFLGMIRDTRYGDRVRGL